MDNIWDANLVDMWLRSGYNNKGIQFLSRALDIFSRYAWIVPLKMKKALQLLTLFKKTYMYRCKPNKIWVDKDSKFYNRLMKSWLKDNDKEIYTMEICNRKT